MKDRATTIAWLFIVVLVAGFVNPPQEQRALLWEAEVGGAWTPQPTPTLIPVLQPQPFITNDSLANVNFGPRNGYGFEPMTGASDCMLSSYANMSSIGHRQFYSEYISDLGYFPKMWGWDLSDEPAYPHILAHTTRRLTGREFAAYEAPLTPELLAAAPVGAIIAAWHGYNKISFDGTTLVVYTQWINQPIARFTLAFEKTSFHSAHPTWKLIGADGAKINNVTVTYLGN